MEFISEETMQKSEAVALMVSRIVCSNKSRDKIQKESISLLKIDFKGSACAKTSSGFEAELKHKC